jgi:hypothetical protein
VDEFSSGPIDVPAKQGPEFLRYKALETMARSDGGSGIGYASALFDNVRVKEAVEGNFQDYDDFESAPLDQTRWQALEFVREISGDRLRLNAQADEAFEGAYVRSIYGTTPYLEAKIRVETGSVVSGAPGRARLRGFYYNDTYGPGNYNGSQGDVFAYTGIKLAEGSPLSAIANIYRCHDSGGSDWREIFTHEFSTEINFDTVYTFSIEFTGSSLIFTCDGETYTYDIPTTTPIYPPSTGQQRRLESWVFAGTGQSGYMKATFDDVYVSAFPMEFTRVREGGFDDAENLEDHNHCVFKNRAYIGTYNNSGGEIWASSDGTTWVEIEQAHGGFGNPNNTGIGPGETTVFDGYLYSGTNNMMQGAELWRSPNGEDWERVLAGGLNALNNFGIYHLVEFKGKLFCETNNNITGTEIWMSSDGLNDWQQVEIDEEFEDSHSLWCGLYVIDDFLYATVFNYTTGAQIWRTVDGTNWELLVQDGFGDWRNFWCRLTKFKDKIYASTRNWSGGEVWRSSNGTDWEPEPIIDDGFGNPNNVFMTIHNPISTEDFLYIGTRNDATGGELWRTFDGVSWCQVACCGFQNPNNFRLKPFTFGNQLYVATCNHATGMEVWKEIPNTSAGDDVAIEPVDDTTGETPVTVTFDEVIEGGEGTTSLVTLPEGNPEPPGFKLGEPATYYEITTTAEYSGQIEVCISYNEEDYENENDLGLFHYENGTWADVTISLDTTNNEICGLVDSFSALAILEPTEEIEVEIDIKPGSYPNSINLASKGAIAVAILATDDFDVMDVDPETVRFAGAQPQRSRLKDVDDDGDKDLLFHFKILDLVELGSESQKAYLIGETDELSIWGKDSVKIASK